MSLARIEAIKFSFYKVEITALWKDVNGAGVYYLFFSCAGSDREQGVVGDTLPFHSIYGVVFFGPTRVCVVATIPCIPYGTIPLMERQ